MLKKIASLAAMLSGALTVASCQTAMYKPIICQPGTALKDGRCQKVRSAADRHVDAPKTKVQKKPIAEGPGISAPRPPKMNVYGQPIAK